MSSVTRLIVDDMTFLPDTGFCAMAQKSDKPNLLHLFLDSAMMADTVVVIICNSFMRG